MGSLFIVSTPIGNIKDITFRAIEVLKKCDYVLCEDTRVSGKLLAAYDIQVKLESFNDFNEDLKMPKILDDLKAKRNIALISDAGTPLISDPGYKLVREAIKEKIHVESIPGPTSVISAITISGLPPDKFIFLGYLPKKNLRRENYLRDLKPSLLKVQASIVFFESPYRVLRSLESLLNIFGDIEVVIVREQTKKFEEVLRGKVSDLTKEFESKNPKGEFVVLFSLK